MLGGADVLPDLGDRAEAREGERRRAAAPDPAERALDERAPVRGQLGASLGDPLEIAVDRPVSKKSYQGAWRRTSSAAGSVPGR